MSEIQTLVHGNLLLIAQGRELLRSLGREVYARPAPELHLAAAGGHFRHCIDFYASFLRGLEPGRVDYDARERDPRTESDPAVADAQLAEVEESLRALAGHETEDQLVVRPECRDDAGGWSISSLPRELHFLASHTVHHYALIAVVLRVHGVAPQESFGVAPSTLRYREEQQSSLETQGS